jgi:hypothetical protein
MKRALVPIAALLAGAPLAGCPKPTAKPSLAPTPAPIAGLRFRDVAKEAGLDYAWKPQGKRPLNILQTIGNGCAFLDYNNDGNLDILLVGPKPALYKGDGKGRFTEVTSSALGDLSGHFLGVAVGDIDNDGFDDLYLSGYRDGRLLRNESGKRFVDITKAAGLKPQPWGTSASFADLDRDGFLDLFVCNYVNFVPGVTKPQRCLFPTADKKQRLLSSCGPRYYDPIKASVWRNRGGTRFEDRTVAWGATQHVGKGLGVACVDYEGIGRDGVAVANDEMAGNLFLSQPGGALKDRSVESGTAYDREGNVHAGMGIDWGDANNNGRFDLVLTTFRNEAKSLYRNDGQGLFTDIAFPSGIGKPAFVWVSFGIKFFDADNDGWLDVAMASGHVQDNIDILEDTTYRQPLVMLHNKGVPGQAIYDDVSQSPSIAGLSKIVGRGLAVGDYDNDGKVDVLVVDAEGAPLLLHNETETVGNFLSLRLEGRGGNRGAHGAIVTATLPDGAKRMRHCQTDGSYLSASDRRVHIGIGAAVTAAVSVRWTDGSTTMYADVPAGHTVTLRQGDATISSR